jgi:hypothetical protein
MGHENTMDNIPPQGTTIIRKDYFYVIHLVFIKKNTTSLTELRNIIFKHIASKIFHFSVEILKYVHTQPSKHMKAYYSPIKTHR